MTTKKQLNTNITTFFLPSLLFLSGRGLVPSENRQSPRSSKYPLSSAGGIVEDGLCLTHSKSWPPMPIPTIMCVP